MNSVLKYQFKTSVCQCVRSKLKKEWCSDRDSLTHYYDELPDQASFPMTVLSRAGLRENTAFAGCRLKTIVRIIDYKLWEYFKFVMCMFVHKRMFESMRTVRVFRKGYIVIFLTLVQ